MPANTYPDTLHLGEWLQSLGQTQPSHPAIKDADGTLTWQDFATRIRQTGNALLNLGLQPGDRVAILLPDTRTYLEAEYGTMSAGLVRVPLDPRLAPTDISSILNYSGASALIASSDVLPSLSLENIPTLKWIIASGASIQNTLDLATLQANGSRSLLPKRDPDDLATLSYSGGTTGAPKGIALRHRNLASVLRQTIAGFNIAPDTEFLNVRPLWPIAQLVMLSHLAAGGTIHLGGAFNVATFADLVASTGVTRSSLVPTQLFRLLDHLQPNDPRLTKLEAIYIGGARLQRDVFAHALSLVGPRIGVLYGMTEAPISAYLSPEMAAADSSAIVSVGRPVPGCTIKLAGPDGLTDSPGESGEVLISGPHLMREYWKNPEATESSLQGGWLHTGDIGEFDCAGRLHIVGRMKEIIRTGATTVIPAEVEDVLISHSVVSEAAVIGLPDPEWGEAVTGFVTLKPNTHITEAELKLYCKHHLTGYKVPRTIYFLDQLPRSHYGKILRLKLLEAIQNGQSRNTE